MKLNKLAFVVRITLFGGVLAATVNAQPSLRAALDFDGDGKADRTIFRSDENYWHIKTQSFELHRPFGAASTDTIAPGDFDGDGKGDIAIWRETEGRFHYFQSSTNTAGSRQLGLAGDEPVARDYDGDGKTDCAVVRRTAGNLYWYIWESLSNLQVGYQYGISSDFPAPGDYDGDGRFDRAVQRAAGGYLYFYVFQSTAGSFSVQFGQASDLFVPGDYDGDGKTDIAVVRGDDPNGNYEWYIRRSSDGSSLPAMYFGLPGRADVPVQADYDGDGKTDIAVWVGSSPYVFHVQQSTNGLLSSVQYGKAGIFL